MRRYGHSIACMMALILLVSGIPPATSTANSQPVHDGDEQCQVMSLPFSFPEAEAQVDGSGQYLILEIEGTTGYSLLPGAPMLPFWGEMLSFPPGTGIIGADLVEPRYDEHILAQKIIPAPERVPNIAGAGPAPSFEGPAYRQNALFPQGSVSWSMTTGMGERGGIEAHLFIKVFPSRYNPVTGQIIQLKSGTLNIKYSPPPPSLTRWNETYDIIILTPPEFQAEMSRYEDHKESIGFAVKMVNLTEVYSNTFFNVSTGRDNQEKIKLFLAAARLNWSAKYVVLAGDTDKFPTRTAYIADIDGTATPSDLYYGDLFKNGNSTFCDWDRDRDNRYAESDNYSANQDAVDFDPDVALGRFPASNAAELRAMINKTIGYAANVSNDWFQNVTLVGSDTFPNRSPWNDTSGVAEGEYGCDRSATYLPLFNLSRFYETGGTFNPTNIKNCLNRGEGFALFADHGNVDGVVYPSSGGVGLNSPTASGLTNGRKLPLSILDACLTHAIDYSESLGEYLVLDPNGGSINSIGATRIGYGMFGVWHTYANSGYMMVNLMKHFGNGTIMPGPMLDRTKRSYISDVGIWDYADVKTLVSYIQLGDPVTFIGGPGIGYSVEDNSMWADPKTSAYYRINIQNSALRSDSLNFTISEGKWHCSVATGPVVLSARSSVNITLRVDVDQFAQAYETDNCTLVIVPRSTGLPITLDLTTGANCVRRIDFTLNKTRFAACPGESISFNYSILNQGNSFEMAHLILLGGNIAWNAQTALADGNIVPYSQFDGSTSFKVPQRCLAGGYGFRLEMRTDSQLSRSLSLEVTVKQVSGFEIRAVDERAFSAGGARFQIIVENTGNHPDSCGLSIDDLPAGWSAVCPARLGLYAYCNKTVSLNVMPGRYTLAGDYPFKISLFSERGLLLQTQNLTVTVNRTSSLELLCPENHQVVEKGSDTSFDLEFHSQSNFEEKISIAPLGLPAGWDWFMAPDQIHIAPFSSLFASITFQVPAGARADTHLISIEAGTPAWKKVLYVTVEVLVQRSFTASLDSRQASLPPGNATCFGLTIQNTGNCPDLYILSADGPFSVFFSSNMLALDPRSGVTMDIGINVPPMARSGDHRTVITVESARDPNVRKTLTIDIRVDRISRLSLDYDPGSGTDRGKTGTFWLELSNSGPDNEMVSLSALSPSWNAGCPGISVPSGASNRVPVHYTVPDVLEEGEYDLSFVASSELQSWNITHKVKVPPAPLVRGHTVSVSGGSIALLPMIMAAILVLGSIAAIMTVWMLRKKRSVKPS